MWRVADISPLKASPEEVMLLALLERAYNDLHTTGYYKRTAIAWFLGLTPCSPPECVSFKTVIAELQLNSSRIKYLLDAAYAADKEVKK